MEYVVRLIGSEIKGIKNVNYGKIKFNDEILENFKLKLGDVTGIYGQNGSGKSAFIDYMSILKDYLSENSLSKYCDLINIDSGKSELKYTFFISIENKKYLISLIFVLNKVENKVVITEECIKYKELDNSDFKNIKELIKSSNSELLSPLSSFNKIIKKDDNEINLRVSKKLNEMNGTSFIFSKEFLDVLKKEVSNYKEFKELILILFSLKRYSSRNLFVITNKNLGIINLQTAFPLTIKTSNSSGSFFITGEEIIINEKVYSEVCKVIDQINIVIGSIIPGMKLKLFESRKDFVSKDEINIVLQLISIRNNKEIPMKNESEGIKKIISILSALIATYNDDNVCLVVDELDAGIFEYLLGELLYILSQGIRGQLIFTSHNLRILEKLNKDSIVFTTTNPDNRYTRFKKIKPTNNLRDIYIREMLLNEQKEKLYEETSNGDIEFALYKAGVFDEKK